MSHAQTFFREAAQICAQIDTDKIETMAVALAALRENGGRLFIIGVGGSAANGAHAVNDFRKLCGIETYAPMDNVSELTARTNDEGWETVFSGWLEVSKLGDRDAVLVLSVGGGNAEKNVSVNIIRALELAKARGAQIFGIVSRDGGYTGQVGDVVVIVPTVHPDRVTPHAEGFQAVVWHCLVSHPALQVRETKW
ncbi:SIS domain-containing protein [Sulfidibacter corallicola]|uniref:SIS domain-containing protein n=1 Tax=Sulfidibacter corallicola TaxID=2818388 RepID=A0A8A4U409_SULCO|nr:SIS domain-containing protein [Sulfidibacter corallicola]QTD53485.1 SIS domain-containing protein [Sulfidibacter corallicola]